jgi:hypothetical protein
MITRAPMSADDKRIFDFFKAHPLRKAEDAVNENPDMDPTVVLNSVYMLYFNSYILKDLKFKGCYSVNPFIEEEELEHV